jgi:hypothetical protein
LFEVSRQQRHGGQVACPNAFAVEMSREVLDEIDESDNQMETVGMKYRSLLRKLGIYRHSTLQTMGNHRNV